MALREIDLNRTDKITLVNIEKVNKILTYLALGNTLKLDGRFYRMDGDMNVFIVPVNEDGTPKKREENNFPIFAHEWFWSTLIQNIENIDEKQYEEIKVSVAASKALIEFNERK